MKKDIVKPMVKTNYKSRNKIQLAQDKHLAYKEVSMF